MSPISLESRKIKIKNIRSSIDHYSRDQASVKPLKNKPLISSYKVKETSSKARTTQLQPEISTKHKRKNHKDTPSSPSPTTNEKTHDFHLL